MTRITYLRQRTSSKPSGNAKKHGLGSYEWPPYCLTSAYHVQKDQMSHGSRRIHRIYLKQVVHLGALKQGRPPFVVGIGRQEKAP